MKLASNEMPEPPISAVVAAVTEAASGVNRYADHRAGAVRAALAERLGVSPESGHRRQRLIGCASADLPDLCGPR